MGPVGGMFPGMVVGVPEGEIEGGEWGDMDIFIDGEGWFVADFEGVADSMDEDDPPTPVEVPQYWPFGDPEDSQDFYEEVTGEFRRGVYIHPQWSRDKHAWILCRDCKGFWWEWDHPYAKLRVKEGKAIKGGGYVLKRCPTCGGLTVGEYGDWPYKYHGEWIHPLTKKIMTYLGLCKEGRYIMGGVWIVLRKFTGRGFIITFLPSPF